MNKELVKGLIIGMIVATAVVTIYFKLKVNKLEDYYTTKYPKND